MNRYRIKYAYGIVGIGYISEIFVRYVNAVDVADAIEQFDLIMNDIKYTKQMSLIIFEIEKINFNDPEGGYIK